MFDQFADAVADASAWAYLILVVVAFLDALLPVVPSETSVITAGVVAADGHLSLSLVLMTAAAGAFLGDNAGYGIGHRYGPRAQRRLLAGARAQRRLAWADHQLATRGGGLIVVARFVPGGRTAVALTAGVVRYPWRRFARYDVIAAAVWAAYAGLLGFWGGKAFETAPWKGLLLALATATVLTSGGEAVRRLWSRRRAGRPARRLGVPEGPLPLALASAQPHREGEREDSVSQMRIVVAYESMYGSTHKVASAVAAGCADDDVTVVPVSELEDSALAADLLVIGTPTHAHTLPKPASRHAAVDAARTRYDEHEVEPAALQSGVREWLTRLPDVLGARVAVFDTRFRLPAWLTGHPARKLARALEQRGATVVAEPASFFVDRHENLRPGELDRAREWGLFLRAQADTSDTAGPPITTRTAGADAPRTGRAES